MSAECGCFHCGRSFPGADVKTFHKEDDGRETALCPFCGYDTVISAEEDTPSDWETCLYHMRIRFFSSDYEEIVGAPSPERETEYLSFMREQLGLE